MSEQPKPFDDLRAVLTDGRGEIAEISVDGGPVDVRLDLSRRQRTGIPEIVHAEHKTPDAVAAALVRLAEGSGRAMATRCSRALADTVQQKLEGSWIVERHDPARVLVVARLGAGPESRGGRVGILAAGTSDLPVAAEAALVAREMGATVDEAFDVGVAGLHRLVVPLERMVERGVDAIIVVAGADGALPSVVAGLVAVPVIGLPTSVGYGFGGGGVGAMTTMLQSCAPGLVVVNIDNGVGAGSTAALIANRVAAARRSV